MAPFTIEEISVGWSRWEEQLKEADPRCLAFAEALSREAALENGFDAVNIRWEPHNWSGAQRIPHDWHITVDFDNCGSIKTAHIYCQPPTSSSGGDWAPVRELDGTIKTIFQEDRYVPFQPTSGVSRSRSMPELRPRPFVLGRPCQQARRFSVFLSPPQQPKKPFSAIAATSWRSGAESDGNRSRANTWPPANKSPLKRSVLELKSWR